MDFTDKVVLITGSSRGIGRAAAQQFAEKGARVVIHYNS
ncbi:MAG: SDR family NAD(P)-dependent oxidoreductase, partial [Anaerolineales bacterium]|nr:SDR family NAD(P)-dependent oxidoreductase [Anaerolineales bacterium]